MDPYYKHVKTLNEVKFWLNHVQSTHIKKITGEAYVLTKEEGDRHTPFFTSYRAQFYFRTTDVTGSIALPEGTEMVMLGDNIAFEIDLLTPVVMGEGLRFAMREGGRTVGAGVVSKILD